jgi:hypothetical protein
MSQQYSPKVQLSVSADRIAREVSRVQGLIHLTKAIADEYRTRDAEPTMAETVDAATEWLCRAQDYSASQDGGVARHYSPTRGWAASYPETTGYIIPTILDRARDLDDVALFARARRMLDWLVSIQFPDGGIQGGVIGQRPNVPVTFNTGQVLLGFARGVEEFGDRYRPAMRAAADWLVDTQDEDGAWRKHPTPFAATGEKTYETHVAWGLFEAARIAPGYSYEEAGLRNIAWALTKQADNGWLADCCLNEPHQPLTHTIAYALRGIIEAYHYSGEQQLLEAAVRTATGALGALQANGALAGRLDAQWRPAVNWVCLTGSVQMAHCWLLLYLATGDTGFRDAGLAANRYVRSTIRVRGSDGIRGGVRGSAPAWGRYGRFEYLNWACKFFIDSQRLEQKILEHGRSYSNGSSEALLTSNVCVS